MPSATWKESLAAEMPPAWAREIDVFEKQIELRRQGKIEEKLFAETRLRRGVYGQRYDNGQRHDGEKTQELKYPCGDLTKGPSTVWDAPGMMRIKIPFGHTSARQLEVMSALAEEYSDQILHVTTRQDIQLHFIHIEDTPDLMRRLAAVGITTREACGNSVRNVTACQFSGVCQTETFDVTPYANALAFFLLGHDDAQDFGRKFKVAFSGCKANPCGLVNFHDLGAIAKAKEVDGVRTLGFELYVGGGLGSVPHPAELYDDFLPPEELLPVAQAICRVFARLGEKANRARARIKFLVKKLGIDEFRRLVQEERAKLRPDERWTAFLSDLHTTDDKPIKEGRPLPAGAQSPAFERFRASNIQPQRQPNYSTVTLRLPLGDFTSDQGRALADLMRKYSSDSARLTADQNILLRWVSNADLPALHRDLEAVGLARAGANTIADITSCPGTDTCKLGISSSRALAAELVNRLEAEGDKLPVAARKLVVKASGCFNSCGQHHVADMGFLGVSRNVNGRRVPHFQLVVGGQWQNNAGDYGLAIGAVPSKRVPEVMKRVIDLYVAERQGEEDFHTFIGRIGKKTIRKIVEELQVIPSYEQDPSTFSDWGDPREYTIGDMGVGECAGEVVPFVEMGLAASEREVFEAQDMLSGGDVGGAARRAYSAMLQAAKSLTKERNQNLGDAPGEIVAEFKRHYVDTQLFFDPFAGPKFAQYLLRAHEDGARAENAGAAHRLIEEAQLFVEAAHQCYARLGAQNLATGSADSPGSRLMDAAKLQVKLYAAGDAHPPLAGFVPIFHDFIRNRVLPELMIDVASYEHVPSGPGVLFVGHGSDYFIDEGKGRLGLLYSRKRAGPPPVDRLADAFRRTLHVATLLEQDVRLAGKLRFRTDEVLVRINDRLAAPSSDETFAACKPELLGFFEKFFAGRPFTLARTSEARELFAVTVRLAGDGAPTVAEALPRVGGTPTAG